MNINRIKLRNFVMDMIKIRPNITSDKFVQKLGLRSYGELDQYLLEKSKSALRLLFPSMALILRTSTDNFTNILDKGDYEALVRAEDALNRIKKESKKHKNNINQKPSQKTVAHQSKHQNHSSNRPQSRRRPRSFIERVREKHGFTVKKFAKGMNTSEKGVMKIQHARRLSIRTLLRIAMVLNVSPYDLAKYYHYDFNKVDDVIKQEKSNAKSHAKQEAKAKKLASLGNYLVYCRHKKGLSQVKVAKKYGIGTATISRIETGKAKHIDIKIASLFSKAYQVPLINILKRTSLYKNLQLNSPSAKIINICKHHSLNISNFVKKTGVVSSTVYHILMKKQQQNDKISQNLENKIIKAFNLPKNYFSASNYKKHKTIPNKKKNFHKKQNQRNYSKSDINPHSTFNNAEHKINNFAKAVNHNRYSHMPPNKQIKVLRLKVNRLEEKVNQQEENIKINNNLLNKVADILDKIY